MTPSSVQAPVHNPALEQRIRAIQVVDCLATQRQSLFASHYAFPSKKYNIAMEVARKRLPAPYCISLLKAHAYARQRPLHHSGLKQKKLTRGSNLPSTCSLVL